MASEHQVNIRPGVGVLALFPSMNYKAWYALGELVDNALDSYLSNRQRLHDLEGGDYKLRIIIDVEPKDGGYVRVWDNAAGIDEKNYGRAFVTAEPPPSSAGLSQFGIGMKSASCWFAREWRVRSTALGEAVERTIEFDVPVIIRDNIESLEPTTVSAPAERHFTEVRLWNLYKPPWTKTTGKMRQHLASMYRQYLRDEDITIEFNGEDLYFEDPKVLVAPHYKNPLGEERVWERQLDFQLASGERVKGFVAIRAKGNTRDAGLSLYRHKRLIMGSGDEPYRPAEIFGGSNSFAYQRVFGELDLDDFDVSHTKDSFIWGEREAEMLQLLKEQINSGDTPILAQAEGYRARVAPPDLTSAAMHAAVNTAAVLSKGGEVVAAQMEATPVQVARLQAHEVEVTSTTTCRTFLIKNETWKVDIETTTDPAATEWVRVRERRRRGTEHELGILLSLSHPFTQRFGGATAEDVEGLLRLAVGLAIAETTAREAGVGMAGVVTKNLNELLGGVLAIQ